MSPKNRIILLIGISLITLIVAFTIYKFVDDKNNRNNKFTSSGKDTVAYRVCYLGKDSSPVYLPDDLDVSLWAESPMFYNPTNIDVDVKGRIWVAEAVNYRDFNTKTGDRLSHGKGDRIIILEDTDNDGRADSSKIFVQDTDLVAPLGLAVIGNRIIVSCSPNIIVYTDVDGDDIPDHKEILLQGFGGRDHDHGVHAVVAGPDGHWYFNTGNAGPHVVTDKSGWTLRSGSIYTGGTPYNLENQGGNKSDDGRIWTGGLALRLNKEGKGLKVMAHNFRNSYELTVDSYGNLWQNDNDDQVIACRTSFIIENGNAGYFSNDGTRTWQADRRPGQDMFTAHWHQDDPSIMPAGDNTGAGAPTGIVFMESNALGKAYNGLLFSADAGRNVIYSYKPTFDGAGYKMARTNFLSSLSSDNVNYKWNDTGVNKKMWFRPSDVAIGTDGSLFIADWFDPIVGGHAMNEKKGYGRIYRVFPKGKKLLPAKIDVITGHGLLEALKSPSINVRNLGFELLLLKGAQSIQTIQPLLKDSNPFYRARAVWLLSRLGEEGVEMVEKYLDDSDPNIRITAFRALRQVKENMIPYAEKLKEDKSAAVHREIAIALRDVPLHACAPVLKTLIGLKEYYDPWYLAAIATACQDKEEEVYKLIIEPDLKTEKVWSEKTVSLVFALGPGNAVNKIIEQIKLPLLKPALKRKLLCGLAFINNKSAAQAMLSLTNHKDSVLAASAFWWLNFRSTNDWKDKFDLTKIESLPLPGSYKKMLGLQNKYLRGTSQEKLMAILTMVKDAEGAKLLINMAASGLLPDKIKDTISSYIFDNPSPEVRVLASDYFRRRSGMAYSIDLISRMQANAEQGKKVFISTCASCHRSGNLGKDIGPDLSSISQKFDRISLLDAIINPAATTAFGYEGWQITTNKKIIYYGFILADGSTIILKDLAGNQIRFSANEIKSRKRVSKSLMPDAGLLGLADSDLANVAEYLRNHN